MLSILIPIYNVSVVKLVNELIFQCNKNKITFEIICLDDGSTDRTKENNHSINHLFGVNYVELSQNVGRSKIRNQLGKLARYPYLLFIDADSKIPSRSYIKTYLNYLKEENWDLLYGGTEYSKKKPSKSKELHWKYGMTRECPSLKIRNK